MGKDLGVVYLAAGVSKRFNYLPKALEKVGVDGETLIEYSMNQSLNAGFNKIFIVVSDKTQDLFKEKFKDTYRGVPIIYSKQSHDETKRSKPWGQVDALCSLKGKIDCPFVVCNSDDLYGQRSFEILYNHLDSKGLPKSEEAAAVHYKLADVLSQDGVVNRGIFKEVGGIVNQVIETFAISLQNLKSKKLSLEDKCSMGIFALYPKDVHLMSNYLEKFKKENENNPSAELPFGIVISSLISDGDLDMRVYDSESEWMGITNPGDEEIVKERIRIQRGR